MVAPANYITSEMMAKMVNISGEMIAVQFEYIQFLGDMLELKWKSGKISQQTLLSEKKRGEEISNRMELASQKCIKMRAEIEEFNKQP